MAEQSEVDDPEDQFKDEFKMHFLKTRLESFKESWPFQENCTCTPMMMAAAGFFHCPTDKEPDLAKCYLCQKELDGWEPQDDPWKEHKSHSNKCPFLKLSDPANPTIEELLKLESERQRIFTKKIYEAALSDWKAFSKDAEEQLMALKGK